MVVWLATWCDVCASLMLACIGAIVAIALIGFSLFLIIAAFLIARCESYKKATTRLG
ncbi:hypothetical protein [Bradyrhizobium frederickii]|uniref:hypothetical protein n=1 Tax=Bradyrhizobium frederickii TaxID=2560054 RepID=UPI001430C831|nr:hypothetical protein [Bradyrhizobium frederickii]